MRPQPTPEDGVGATASNDEDEAKIDEEDEESASAGYDDHPSIRQYKAITRYPTSTRRLNKESIDLLNPNKRHERRQPVPDAQTNESLVGGFVHRGSLLRPRGRANRGLAGSLARR